MEIHMRGEKSGDVVYVSPWELSAARKRSWDRQMDVAREASRRYGKRVRVSGLMEPLLDRWTYVIECVGECTFEGHARLRR
jgi:hypothetical protein